ncbi:hypothetical protein TD95_003502 [Thielaviopsis punctulata]|uniref:Eukaryotic translation initiation factor 3 subunit B n=1 Tax=Thielaviopsis punctulata TaxID=72032 RepID=A0A0F4ZJD4_9PEZI|nr:hypothetical protein TD95_003502 [Thielaviopsis punctulata]
MAPSFDHLREADLDEDEWDEEEIDLSDLREKFEVQLESGYDTFVVVDGLPEVTEEQKPKLVRFLTKKLVAAGTVRDDSIFMPMGENGKSLKFAFVEYETPNEAANAVRQLDGIALDKKHTLRVNKMTDIDRYGREGRVSETYVPPEIEPFEEKEHLRSFMADPSERGRDQIVMQHGDQVGIFWNNGKENPENIVTRQNWTETFVQWSPLGTYLTSVHAQGVQLWGGASWSRLRRFAHPFCNLVHFSPKEKYMVTWSARPISIPEEGHPVLSIDDDGKNFIIWDIDTGAPLRSFANLEVPSEDGSSKRPFASWPVFKWSADDKYVARLNPGQSISVYELPRMNMLDKSSIKVDGVMDFEWAPATPQREGVKKYEQLLCYWTPEQGSNPAKVGLMSLPSKEIVRSLNLFSVTDAKLHWQSEAKYLCVKVDRHSKSKKFQEATLEIFRIREKGVPVEVVSSIKDIVRNFSWEPKGDRFVIITTPETPAGAAVPVKSSVSFYCPEKVKGPNPGNFKHLRTLDKKNSNSIYWSPRGRFVLVAAVSNQQASDLEFYDVDFEGEKPEAEKDLMANLQQMNIGDHYGVTDIEWDPSGRYVATWSSFWKHGVENGYHIYDFRGELLREDHLDKFKMMGWRPRPPSLLTKEEQKAVRKNLREYSRAFEQEDAERGASADQAVVEARRTKLNDWYAFYDAIRAEVAEERDAMGLPADPTEALLKAKTATLSVPDTVEATVEEVIEDVLEETEEIVA